MKKKVSSKKKNSFSDFFKNIAAKWKALPKNKKIITIVVLAVVLVLLILALIVNSYFNLVDWGGSDYEPPTGDGYIQQDNTNFDTMSSVDDATGLQDYLKKWHNNEGDLMKNKNVVNVLLMGLDEAKIHSDSMILLSVNKVTKKVTMTSIFRDTYTYSDVYSTANKSNFMKMTETYTFGGPKAVISTIEKDFKIKIDGYVSVNFDTFPEVIDALGGVTVEEVKPYEAKYMLNSEFNTYVPSGKNIKLNGKQALIFSRIRYCDVDGDVSRTRRQRMVITGLIEATKNANVSQIDKVLNAVLPSVSTSFGRMDFVKYATQAITYKWMTYPIEQLQMPNAENRSSATLHGTWYWIADLPACARDLQTAIYGKTNIEIDEDSKTAMDYLNLKPNYTPSAPAQNDPTDESDIPSESRDIPESSQAPSEPSNEPSSNNEPSSGETPSNEPSVPDSEVPPTEDSEPVGE